VISGELKMPQNEHKHSMSQIDLYLHFLSSSSKHGAIGLPVARCFVVSLGIDSLSNSIHSCEDTLARSVVC